MPLPTPQTRQLLHTRQVVYRGYLRDDGLWDIEGEMQDTKAYAMERNEGGVLPPGTPLHGMAIRATLDDTLTIRAIVSSTEHAPFGECQQGADPMQRMMGVAMGPGWRQAIERALGGTRGCTHLRELLYNMATAAFQTIPVYRNRPIRAPGEPAPAPRTPAEPPFFMNKCIAWDFNGTVVARHYPQFVGWQPVRRAPAADDGAAPA